MKSVCREGIRPVIRHRRLTAATGGSRTQIRNRALVRTWRLVDLLRSSRGLTLEDLSAQLGVTTRTIRRDLVTLEEVHVPIVVGRFDDRIPRYRLLKGDLYR